MKRTRLAAAVTALIMAASLVSCGSVDSSAEDIKPSASAADSTAPADEASDGGDVSSEEDTSEKEDTSETEEKSDFEESDEPLDDDFKKASFDFAAELFKKVCSKDIGTGKNTMVSPTSVMQALALAANGADGETLAEFEKLLGGTLSIDDINRNTQSLITSIKNSEDVKFSTANSIWVREAENFSLIGDYQEKCARVLDAGSFVIPFDQSGADRVNSWVEKNTNGMIKKLIDSFTPEDMCVLANCMAFEGEWNKEYKDGNIDEKGKFVNASGKQEDCVMLTSYEDMYIKGDGVTGFMKDYKGGKYRFVALLPDKDSSVKELAQSLTGEKLSELVNGVSREYSVKAIMPEFKFDYDAGIASQIRDMGLEQAFRDSADFSKMSETKLFIGDIIHKTHIELDRKGTKAAAATGIIMRTNSIEAAKKEVTVKLDRPFMFAIVDANTNLPVFMGIVNSVKQ